MHAILKQNVMYIAGLAILSAVWAKHRLKGYTQPNRVQKDNELARISYIDDVVRSWQRFLPEGTSFRNRDILELGPGSSLGTGALLLAHGARSYFAVDAFQLARRHDASFLTEVINRLSPGLHSQECERAKTIVCNPDDRFDYRAQEDFSLLEMAGGRQFDMMVSCAAFEHFTSIETTIEQMSKLARPGCMSLHIVDFQTHSRWIRDADPNNIYRYPAWLYNLLSFPGQPNRKRPSDYRRILEANGWEQIAILPALRVDASLLPQSLRGLARPFLAADAEMAVLNGVVLAVKK